MISEPPRPPIELPNPEKLADLARRQRALRSGFLATVLEDARIFSVKRQEKFQFAGRVQRWMNVLRLIWRADEFLSLFLYRVRMALHDRRVPVIPRLLYYASSFLYGVRINHQVIIEAGIYLPHGQCVIGGLTRIGRGCYISPWTSIGLVQGNATGPTIGRDVFVGTGARILGDITVGDGARIGTNAVVLKDVPAGAIAVGIPARIIESGEGAEA